MKSAWDFTKTLVKELENYCDPNKKRTRTRQNALLCLLERAKKDLESIKRLEVFRINFYINKVI